MLHPPFICTHGISIEVPSPLPSPQSYDWIGNRFVCGVIKRNIDSTPVYWVIHIHRVGALLSVCFTPMLPFRSASPRSCDRTAHHRHQSSVHVRTSYRLSLYSVYYTCPLPHPIPPKPLRTLLLATTATVAAKLLSDPSLFTLEHAYTLWHFRPVLQHTRPFYMTATTSVLYMIRSCPFNPVAAASYYPNRSLPWTLSLSLSLSIYTCISLTPFRHSNASR